MTYEQQEREIIIKWLNSDENVYLSSITPEGSYKCYDAAILYGPELQRYLVEIKVRDIKSSIYPTAILETDKVSRIKDITNKIKKTKGYDVKIMYVAKYMDNIICIWDAEDVDFTSKKWSPNSTATDDTSKGRTKDYNEYLITKAKKIKIK